MKQAQFRTTVATTGTTILGTKPRCAKCGGIKRRASVKRTTAAKPTVRMISCTMCGKRHAGGTKCKTLDYMLHKAHQLQQRTAARPKTLSEMSSVARRLADPNRPKPYDLAREARERAAAGGAR